MKKKLTIVITGASSGFGNAALKLLSLEGHKVLGTSRNPSTSKENEFELLQLDVRSDESVQNFSSTLKEKTDRIDVLINNAGFSLLGAGEEISIAEAKAQFETNFFGSMRMIQAVLPIMRKQRSGKIINMSSLGGLLSIPFWSVYCASKFALEGFSGALRQEVKSFNIFVTVIEPGFFKTKLGSSLEEANSLIDDYGQMRENACKVILNSIESGPSPIKVAKLITSIIKKKAPHLHYRVGRDSLWLPRIKNLLSSEMFARAIRKKFQLDG